MLQKNLRCSVCRPIEKVSSYSREILWILSMLNLLLIINNHYGLLDWKQSYPLVCLLQINQRPISSKSLNY